MTAPAQMVSLMIRISWPVDDGVMAS
jgi:hypothetical protein